MNNEIETVIVDEGEISLLDLWNIIWRKRVLILLITFIGGFLSAITAYGVSTLSRYTSTIVELNWDKIEQGQYPDGNRFTYSEMFTINIIDNAINDAGLNEVIASEVRTAITVSPIIPDSALELIKTALEKGEQLTYYPTSFTINFDYHEVNLSELESIDLLAAMVDSFRTDFERRFVNYEVVIDYTSTDVTSYDYVESVSILSTQANLIKSLISSLPDNSSSFRSPSTGRSFSDIVARVNLLQQVDLALISSRVNTYSLTKDIDLLLTKYEYDIETKQLQLSTQEDYLTQLKVILENYEGSTSTIIIPGLDSTLNPSTEPYLSTLYANIVSVEKDISTLTNGIAYTQMKIDRLLGLDPDYSVTQEKAAAESLIVENSISTAATLIEDITAETNAMIEEYHRLIISNNVNTLIAPLIDTETNILLMTAIGFILSGMLSLGVVFVLHMKEKNPKKLS